MADNSGYIKISRKLLEWRWHDDMIAMGLWIYLLLKANWKDGWVGGEKISRGEMVVSYRSMVKETKLSHNTIRSWLDKFAEEGQIVVTPTRNGTKVRIIHYEDYQRLSLGLPSGVSFGDTLTDTPTDTPTDTDRRNKESNKARREDKEYVERTGTHTSHKKVTHFVQPSYDEVEEYAASIGYVCFDPATFLDYYSANGWMVGKHPMKDWKATVRNWKRRDGKARPPQSVPLPAYMEMPLPDSKPASQELKDKVKRMQAEMKRGAGSQCT
ncbi:MAG: hypothetical protein PUA95_08265 [Lactimicrobium massiliense]|nr:hypothetical protein [Lactimicrobium massiliense]MDD6230714.1 hypothetical protein [Lactimicrobium massiliense]